MNIELTEKEVKVLNYMLDSYRQSIWDDGCWDLWEIVGEEFLKEQRQAMGLELRYSKGGYAKQSGLLKPMVEEAVKKWMKENPDTIAMIMQNVVEKGVAAVTMNYFKDQFAGPLYEMARKIQEKGLIS